ncbi:heavy-metal-associated domain-containing protein [Bacillus alveayuensis]|uniref:heavy-metal-associated domain-containing protein n=1 Tax=Aeribacillus alveayuensis TaxID=279215 RepID=UPI0005CC92E4|nr:heavy-metal-associated domain-containing protein [Bacillus alveayuensis]
MAEATIFVDEATSEQTIQQIEHLLKQLDGIERVLVDTADGEVKIEFNDKKISKERIIITLQQHNFHIQ